MRMMGARRLGMIVSFATVGAIATASANAGAQENCPLGSISKADNGQTWCEPTICDVDTQCPNGSVCRPIPLCVEIGVLELPPGEKSDAGQRLLVRQRCGADKACPQRTTCSEKGRCITREQADKAGLSSLPGALSDAGGGGAAAAEGKKKSCGCSVPGTSGGELGGGALALLGAIAVSARRRTRRP